MTTAVPGLIKIGKTTSDNYKNRMYGLEHNGYCNVAALKRAFAIEVEQYDEKETMLHTIFAKSRVENTELFALDVNLVMQLLTSFEGTIIYPHHESKAEIFAAVAEDDDDDTTLNGTYVFKRQRQRDSDFVNAKAAVHNGEWTLLKGSKVMCTIDDDTAQKTKNLRSRLSMDENGILLEDLPLGKVTPSCAACVCFGGYVNGWAAWELSNGKPLDYIRNKKKKIEDI